MIRVAVSRQENYRSREISRKLEEVLSASGILDSVRGKKVLVKPNCTGAFRPEEGRTTHPKILRGTLELLLSAGASVKIGESSSVGIDTLAAYQTTEIAQIAQELSVKLVDFKKSQYYEIKIYGGLVLDRIYLPKEVLESDCLLSLAKLKTNYVSGISCAIKNLKGLLRDSDKKKFHHLGIAPALIDLMNCLPKTIGLIDGILGSELYEPVRGDVLIASLDIVALDYVSARIMGLEPKSVEHLRLAMKCKSWKQKLPTDLKIIGQKVSSVSKKFKSQITGLDNLKKEYQVTIRNGQACSSCLGALYLSLKKAKTKTPESLIGTEIVIGNYSEKVGSEALYFGNCAAKRCPEPNQLVPGCVPTTSDFLERLIRLKEKEYLDKYGYDYG